MQEAFDLPDGTVPSLMLALGYPSEKSKPAPLHGQREPIEEFVIELRYIKTEHIIALRGVIYERNSQ